MSDRTTEVFAALSVPTRRAILESLRGGGKSVNDLAARLPVSQPAVSQHLKALREAGLVRVQKDGTRRIYHVDRTGLERLRQYLDGFWGDILDAFVKGGEE